MKGVKDLAIDRLKNLNTGRQQGEGMKRTVWRKQVRSLKDWVVDSLMKPRTGCQDGGGRKTTTLRVIELSQEYPSFHLGSVKIEEYKV